MPKIKNRRHSTKSDIKNELDVKFNVKKMDITESLYASFNKRQLDFVITNYSAIKSVVDTKPLRKIPVPFYLYKSDYAEFVEIENPNEYHKISSYKDVLTKNFIFENSEYSQVFYWDLLIRNPIQEYLDFYEIKYIINRNTQDETTTRMSKSLENNTTKTNEQPATCTRPDFLLFSNGYLIFKGEEKPVDTLFEEAKNDLKTKDCEFYTDILLCYAAAGPWFQLFIMNKNKELMDLSPKYNLTLPIHRLHVVTSIFNICCLLKYEISCKILLRPLVKRGLVKRNYGVTIDFNSIETITKKSPTHIQILKIV